MISAQNDWTSYDEIYAYIERWTSTLVIDYTIRETLQNSNPSLHVDLDGDYVLASWSIYLGSATLDVAYGHIEDDSVYVAQAYVLESIDDVKKHTEDFLNQIQRYQRIY